MREMAASEFPILGQWSHSFEEDSGGLRTYRPWDYPFPPARGRASMEFLPDGTFIDRPVGPADANLEIRGHWEYAGSGLVRLSFGDPSRSDRTLEIVERGDQLLRVRQS